MHNETIDILHKHTCTPTPTPTPTHTFTYITHTHTKKTERYSSFCFYVHKKCEKKKEKF